MSKPEKPGGRAAGYRHPLQAALRRQAGPYSKSIEILAGQCAGIRRAGAASLDLAYVAAGRLDAFWEIGLSQWDIAAGALLVREAGGLVADIDSIGQLPGLRQYRLRQPEVFQGGCNQTAAGLN